jgi:cytochrome c2
VTSGADAKAKSQFSTDASLSQVELGRRLFLAKGCITCHSNSKASGTTQYTTISMGAPDLSKFSASPEALRLRLQDPTQVKSDTMMPNLGLSGPEIEALIAFINSK